MPNKLKQGAIKAFRSFAAEKGYVVAPEWQIDAIPLARHLRGMLKHYEVDCVFDVGGNQGQYRDLVRNEAGFDGWIVSFEPVSQYIELLDSRAKTDPKWKVCPFALGSSAGSATINVTKSPGLNSFLPPSSQEVPGFWQHEHIHAEEVQIRRLDDVFADLRRELGFKAPYLKLDTQGFDMEVVKGGLESLKAMRALQTEASVKSIYAGMPKWTESMQYLTGLGFELSGMFPVTHDNAWRLVEFDAIFVNRRFAEESCRPAE